MNIRVAKEEMAILLPNSLSQYAPFTREPARPRAGGLGATLARALRWVIDMPRRRAVLDELSTLSDRELADIGLSRAELPRVFDPSFTSGREAEGVFAQFSRGRA